MAAGYSETPIAMYHTIRPRIPEDRNFRSTVTVCVDDGAAFL
jgi:hypothetical protein